MPGLRTALVLAGTRPGGDPLAAHAGVSHKALIPVGGTPMLARVLAALDAVPSIGRIVVAIDRDDVLEQMPRLATPVEAMAPGQGPSASVARALEQYGAPLLVTTADHALLEPAWVEEFLAGATGAGADAFVAMARRAEVMRAAPSTRRTWWRFSDGEVSGCNLFLLATPAAGGVVRLWQKLEAQRKHPLAQLRLLGPGHVIRYRFGLLSLPQALARLGRLSGARIAPVLLSDGRAAIDVDKPEDLALVQSLLLAGNSGS
jgi:GTP:adenosylcobinamide-phosphate guanylyltransferase